LCLIAALALAGCGAGEKPAARVGPPGTLALAFADDIGGAFALEQIEAALDGKVVLRCGQEGTALDARAPVALWRGSAGPGAHELRLRLVYRGKGAGLFSYLQGYTFDVKSIRAVDLPPAGLAAALAIAHESGGPMTPIEERPRVRWEDVGEDELPAGPSGCPPAKTDE
jgi:hypothetical protein